MKSILLALAISQIASAAPKGALIVVEDVVTKISKEEKTERVFFLEHAGIYELKLNAGNYKEIKKALELSLKNKTSVSVKADSTYLEIEEVLSK